MPDDPILPIDHPMLSQPSADITVFDEDLLSLTEEMFAVMDRERGAGLAAVQVGRPLRLVVMDVPDDEQVRRRLAMVNPVITEMSNETVTEVDGCLSMPGYYIPVSRHVSVEVEFLDIEGNTNRLMATGVFAICVQHEIDHTNGILFYDHVSRLRRQRAKKYFRKVRRAASRVA